MMKNLAKALYRRGIDKKVDKFTYVVDHESPIIRKRFVFHGKVQKVGFRYEVRQLAVKLGLTGFGKNQEDGTVLIELQGGAGEIGALVGMLEKEKRILITRVDEEFIPVDENAKSYESEVQ